MRGLDKLGTCLLIEIFLTAAARNFAILHSSIRTDGEPQRDFAIPHPRVRKTAYRLLRSGGWRLNRNSGEKEQQH